MTCNQRAILSSHKFWLKDFKSVSAPEKKAADPTGDTGHPKKEM